MTFNQRTKKTTLNVAYNGHKINETDIKNFLGSNKSLLNLSLLKLTWKNQIDIPGRVVTLVASDDPSSSVWGVAYKIKSEDVDKVTNYLDFREKNGYLKKSTTFHPKDKSYAPFDLTLYIATEDNPSYAGPASVQEIAKQIVDCSGPSGPNKEYVYKLAAAMRQLVPNVHDDHLFTIEQEVRKLDQETK